MFNLLRLILLCSLVFLSSCQWCDSCCSHHKNTPKESSFSSAVTDITNKEAFTTLLKTSQKPLVVAFSAEWCPACKELTPIFAKVANELSSNYTFVTIDIDKAKDLADDFGIKGIPTILFFKNGNEIKNTSYFGRATHDQLKQIISKAFTKQN